MGSDEPSTHQPPASAAALAAEREATGTPRCTQCGAVIGVYEPAVTFVDGYARETSRAGASDIQLGAGTCYHRACFECVGRHDDRRADG